MLSALLSLAARAASGPTGAPGYGSNPLGRLCRRAQLRGGRPNFQNGDNSRSALRGLGMLFGSLGEVHDGCAKPIATTRSWERAPARLKTSCESNVYITAVTICSSSSRLTHKAHATRATADKTGHSHTGEGVTIRNRMVKRKYGSQWASDERPDVDADDSERFSWGDRSKRWVGVRLAAPA